MSKFYISCPCCGKYAEARTGFFARKKIDCSCGYIIDVRTDKLATRECPHCGNTVVFDQSLGEKAQCPVCHEPINTMAEQNKLATFYCEQCGVRLSTAKTAERYVCPVCDHENNVAERLASEEIRKQGLASLIKYEGDNDTLVWKHPVEDFNYGSQLIVHESQDAIFFRDGQALDCFGAGRYTLETQRLPVLEKLYQLPTGDHTFHSEVYFVNRATQMGIKWGTDSKVRMFDPASGLYLELGACGEFNIRVTDSRRLLVKIVGTSGGLGQDQLLGTGNGKGFFRAMVMAQVKSYLAQTIKDSGISILEIDAHLMELSAALRDKINASLDSYGLQMPEFFVTRVVTPDDDPDFRKYKQQFGEQYLRVRQEQIDQSVAEAAARRKAVEAQTAAQMKIIGAQGEAEALRIQKQAEADAYRMQAEAEAAEMKMKGYSYQQETSRMVGMEALKNGLPSGGGSAAGGITGTIGDLAGLGISLGAMGSVAGMAKEAINPIFGATADLGRRAVTGGAESAAAPSGWDCSCGTKGIASAFCPNCGSRKPEPKPAADSWDCACGTKGITFNFCPNCGAKRPAAPAMWDCACGTKGITFNFCPNCGSKKPVAVPRPASWDCSCGQKDITFNFCPNCGKKRGE